MQSIKESKPWHRYPLVWMMLSIPFSAVIMGVVMIWLAIDTDDGLVADDYYKQGLAINDVISLDKKAAELLLSATMKFASGDQLIKLNFDKGRLESYPDILQLSFQHATRANSDVIIRLNHGIGNQYIGHLKQLISEGIWYFELANIVDDANDLADTKSDKDNWKLSARTRVGKDNSVLLKSSYSKSN